MNTSGQVSVELKLILDSLRKQAKEAAAILSGALKVGSKDIAPGIENATKKQKEHTNEVKKTTSALKDAKKIQEEWLRAIREGRSVPGQREINVSSGSKSSPGGSSSWSTDAGGGLATPAPQLNAQKNLLNGIQIVTPLQTAVRSSILPRLAMIGAALAGFRVVVGLVAFTLNKLAAPLRIAAEAADVAGRMYAKQLQSGMGAFGIKQSVLASALGVSESDVMQYSAAVGVLNKRLEWSIKVITQETPLLTTTAWRIKELQSNLVATSMRFASAFKPFIDAVIEGSSRLVKATGDFFKKVEVVNAHNRLAEQFGMTMGMKNGKLQYFRNDGTPVGDVMTKKTALLFEKMRKSQQDVAPPPISSANRMASSAWEKMGLVLGNAGQGHLAAVDRNTHRMAYFLEKMHGIMTPPSGNYKEDYAHSRP